MGKLKLRPAPMAAGAKVSLSPLQRIKQTVGITDERMISEL